VSKPLTVPEWMEQYRELIGETGGNTVERLINGKTSAQINLPLAILEVAVRAQYDLLMRLEREGHLR
jgi:hypothetical protein